MNAAEQAISCIPNLLHLNVTVTDKEREESKGFCLWCSATLVRTGKRGPDPLYCSQAHRQRAYEARHIEALREAADTLAREAAKAWAELDSEYRGVTFADLRVAAESYGALVNIDVWSAA